MSLFDKMTIQGIRSFSPESPQKIEFSCPVTLILGPNGTGKTTIIECLKYAATGLLPPGCRQGGSFVHDPKIFGEPEVKAKVALKIKDIRGNEMIVARALTATQKAKNITMKTLEGTIRKVMSDGSTTSISSKCADLDREMIDSLGVSKAVLESVIFCHQEEANWPLSEGKAVKERFDDLFASSRYVKALDAIIKTKKDTVDETKVTKESLKYLKEKKEEGKKKSNQKQQLSAQIDAQNQRKREIEEEYKEPMQQLELLRKRFTECNEITGKINSCKDREKYLHSSIDSMKSKIKEFEGDDEDLTNVIHDADNRLTKIDTSIHEKKEEHDITKEKLKKLVSKNTDLQRTKGHLESSIKQEKDKLLERDNLIKDFSAELDLEVPFGNLTDYDISEFQSQLNVLISTVDNELEEAKNKFEGQENSLLQEITNLKSTQSSIDEGIEKRRKEKARLNTEMQHSRRDLAYFKGDQVEVQRRLDQIRISLSNADTETKVKELDENIKLSSVSKNKMKKTIDELNLEIDRLLKTSSAREEVVRLEKDKRSKHEQIQKLKNKHQDSLDQIFNNNVPETKIRFEFDKKIREYQKSIKEKDISIRQLDKEADAIKNVIKNKSDKMEELSGKVAQFDQKLSDLCGDDSDYERNMDKIIVRKKHLEEEIANFQGTRYTFTKYREKLQKSNPPCPLCHRHFDNQRDVRELIEEIEEKLTSSESDVEKKKRELSDLTKKFEQLLQLKPTFDEIESLKDKEIPQLQTEVSNKKKDLQVKLDSIDTETYCLTMLQDDEETARSIQGDIAVLDRLEREFEEVNERFVNLSSKISASQEEKSVENVQEEKKHLENELNNLEQKIDEMKISKEETLANDNKLKTEENKLTKLSLALQDVERIKNNLQRLQDEDIEDQNRIQPVKDQISKADSNLQQLRHSKKNQLKIFETKRSNLVEKRNKLNNCNDDLKKFQGRKLKDEMSQISQQLADNESCMKDVQQEIESVNNAIIRFTKEKENHRIYLRNLEDNRELRKLLKDLRQAEDERQRFETRLGGIEVNSRDMRSLEKKEEEYASQRQRCILELTKLKSLHQAIGQELNDNFADAEDKYLEKLHELKTLELSASDLANYYKALDRAIMTYHNQKMEEINKIIKELWRNTYRGNDIDYIEIRSDEDEAGANRSRRTYNYRVVMVKSNASLDMRGRCSAGQKVLASLVIRLALAEVFCMHCGVLALDEPTTNLDRDNIESLAFSLVEIIKNRSQQRNFQLIVITHDEDFVELLGRSGKVDHFLKIARNDAGMSFIRPVRIDEQFH